ncbi:MAG: patatin-like phospholipase family protein [Anaerolineae bacterium]
MIAWACSGGGNRGPVQVGAMRALFEAGIVPGMLIGSSAGALNSAFLATDPTPAGVERLAQIWLNTTGSDILPGNFITYIWNVITGADGLNGDAAVRRYFARNIPAEIRTFGDLKIKLYITTADIETAQLYLYGDDPTAPLLDAVLSSSALPPVWPPVMLKSHQYVDGGVVANVPISIAIDKGADTVYALDLEGGAPYPVVHGVYNIAMRTITVLVYQQLLRDIDRAIRFSKITLHHLYLGDIFAGIPLQDFSHTAEMIQKGYERTHDYLAHPTPNQMTGQMQAAAAPEFCPSGAVLYRPPFV